VILVKKSIVASLVALGFVLGIVISPVWAAGAADLSKQCQEALKKTPNKDAEKLCAEGDKLLKDGKSADAEAKFTAGLEKLGIKTKKEEPKKAEEKKK
jgi:outer membrane protein assembly factor BamD (BamD/ComL family)